MENFAGLTAPLSDLATAHTVVTPVPYDATSSWKHGAEKGPEALMEASVQLEWYDTETKTQAHLNGIHTAEPVHVDDNTTPEQLVADVEQRVGEVLDLKKFPLTIGGNHTVSIGAFHAVAKRYKNLTILQFDAHSDLRKSYEGTPLSHACVMTHAKALCPITQVGIRSMSEEETPCYDPQRIFWAQDLYFDREGLWEEKALATLSENVYITFDLDCFDPAFLPSTGTPEPGGLQYFQVLHFMRRVFETRHVVGCDIVELCPNPNHHASDYVAARLAYAMITYKQIQDGELPR